MENVERIEPKKLLEEVRAFRLEKGMTWRKFAGLCGVSEAGLWKVAHGKVEASELLNTEFGRRLRISILISLWNHRPQETVVLMKMQSHQLMSLLVWPR